MITWAKFKAHKPIVLEMPTMTVKDLLVSDFGLGGEFDMLARESLLASQGPKTKLDSVIPIHPDALDALWRWLYDQGYRSPNAPDAADRRLSRLRHRLEGEKIAWSQHPWFQGRSLRGNHKDTAIPAWTDDYFLCPFSTEGYHPVVLEGNVFAGAVGPLTSYKLKKVSWRP